MKDCNSSLRAAADRAGCGVNNAKALVSAVEDKVCALFRDRSLFGQSWLLVGPCLESMQTLLALTTSILYDTGKDVDDLTDILYHIKVEAKNAEAD